MTLKIEDSLLGQLTVPDTEEMLKTLLAPVQAELDQIDAAMDTVETHLKKLRETRRRLMAIKNAASPPKQHQPRKAAPKGRSGKGVSEEKIDQVYEYFADREGQEIKQGDIVKGIPMNSNAVFLAIKVLVERELIYFAGTGGPSGRAQLYKLHVNEEN